MIDINGYTILRQDRSWGQVGNLGPKKGGGVCVYIKNNYNYSDSKLSWLNRSDNNIEIQWILLKPSNQRNIVIANLYRPPQRNIKVFLETLTMLNEVDTDKQDVFLIGDVNIDYNSNDDVHTKTLKDFIRSNGLTQLISVSTRCTENRKSCLDMIITNSDLIAISGVIDVNVSDHDMVFATRKKITSPTEKIEFSGRSYRNYDPARFKQLIRESNWDLFDHANDPDSAWRCMLQNIRTIIDQMCPVKKFRIKKPKDFWLTHEILEYIKDKDHALKRAKRTNNIDDWTNARYMRNQCLSKIRKAKAAFIKTELDVHKNDSKKFWQTIQKILPKSKNKNNKFNLIDQDNNIPVAENDTATYINNYFANICPKLAENFSKPWHYTGERTNLRLDDIIIGVDEVIKLSKEIDITKSSAIENVSSRIIKDAFLAIPVKVCQLFNASIAQGVFPSEWKYATIVPLQKEGDRANITNLRPVSLLPLPGKILEKIVHDRVMQYLELNELLDERQGGFRSRHSTVDTACHFTDDIYKAMNNRDLTIAAFIDLKKAFDTVNHEILIRQARYVRYFRLHSKMAS